MIPVFSLLGALTAAGGLVFAGAQVVADASLGAQILFYSVAGAVVLSMLLHRFESEH
jgi:hypothetical protein